MVRIVSAIIKLRRYVSIEMKVRGHLLLTPARFIPISLDKIYLPGLFEDRLEAKLVFEIGSSNGDDTLEMLEAFPAASIHCFEIEQRAIREWKSKVTSKRAQLHPCLVGSATGTTEFFESYGSPPGGQVEDFPDGWHFSGSIRPPLEHIERYPWVKFRSAGKFPIITLDEFCSSVELNSIDMQIGLIWMDVQGAEGDVLLGGPDTLSRTKFVYAEYSSVELYSGQANLKTLCRLLPDFRIRKIWADDVLFENKTI